MGDHMSRVGFLVIGFSAALCGLAATAAADGLPERTYVGPPPFSWTGLYVGVHTGGAWGHADVSDPFGPSIFGDKVSTPGPFAGGQIGVNWQAGVVVVGLEADFSWADLDGTNTCLAVSGFFISANCHVDTRSFGTLTGRVGTTLGPSGRTLLYAKGGAAWVHSDVDITNNNNNFVGGGVAPSTTTSNSDTQWGWTIGAGMEHALTSNWSVKAEYDFLSFGDSDVATPPSSAVSIGGRVTPIPANTASVSQDIHQFKVGLNYRFGAGAPSPYGSSLKDSPAPLRAAGLEVDFGTRYWYSSGKFQWDNFARNNILQSRLTYDSLTGHSGELFGRVDTPLNLFVKGNVGVGSINSGIMHDEETIQNITTKTELPSMQTTERAAGSSQLSEFSRICATI